MEINKKIEEMHKDIREIKAILTRSKKEGKLIICDECQYPWNTVSEMKYVSCPRCGKKVKNELALKGLSDLGKQTESHIDKEYKKGKSVYDLDLEE